MIDLQSALDTAISAAKAAGEILVSRHRTKLTVNTKSSPRDLVTEVDGLAQEAIIAIIQNNYPDHRFIAEEEGAKDLGDPDSPFVWIIDPLDGTMNFVHGKPEFCTLIALQKNDDPQLGIIYSPLNGKLFHGIKGKGAFLGDTRLKVRETQGMIDAILCTNNISRAKKDGNGILQIATPLCASLHNYGSAAHEMGTVLLGLNDGVFYEGVGLWDVVAGCLLIEEAGGKYRYELLEAGNPHAGVKCVASTAPIFEELCDFIHLTDQH